MDINELLQSNAPIATKISALTKKSVIVPSWEQLEREYNPMKHPVITDPQYKDRLNKGKAERVTRITLGWQKLAVQRMAALLCGQPVKRIYTPKNDAEQQAAKVLEEIYEKNRINAVNLERAKNLYASCENVTLWFAQERETIYAGEKSQLKLRCKNYSPKNGDKLYPLFDEYDDMIALSVRYNRIEDGRTITYFDAYTDSRHVCFNVTDNSEIINEEITLGKIPAVYIHRDEPVWEHESNNVYEAEWSYSRNGNYIRKNSRPTLAIMSSNGVSTNKAPQGDNISRDVVRLGKDDKIEYVTWNASNEALKFHIEELKHNFNSQLMLPDTSMDNMKSSPMSGESRKMLFLDSQMKVVGESGIWLEAYDREMNVVRAFAKAMFPSLSTAIDSLQVKHEIQPFQINDTKERVDSLATAVNGTIASRKTAISRLGWVDDVDSEIKQINAEQADDGFGIAE